jgi:hypothetical protein
MIKLRVISSNSCGRGLEDATGAGLSPGTLRIPTKPANAVALRSRCFISGFRIVSEQTSRSASSCPQTPLEICDS